MNIEKLHKKLIKKNITLSVAESCTGGLLSSKFRRLSGSSKYFQMGLVTYSNNAKVKILKVNKKIINNKQALNTRKIKNLFFLFITKY